MKFFGSFREIWGEKEKEIELQSGSNIGKLLEFLCDSSNRRDQIFNGGEIKSYLAIMKNGKHIQHLNGLGTKLAEGDTIVIFPPVGGG